MPKPPPTKGGAPRVVLREATLADAAFVLELLNDPDWIRFIGNRGVHSLADAEDYIAKKLIDGYREHGFGMWIAERHEDGAAMGMCGLIDRPGVDGIDIGFAFLPAFRGQGYCREACELAISEAHRLGLTKLSAITNFENEASIGLLLRLGFQDAGEILLPGDSERLRLFACPCPTATRPK